MLAAAAPMRAPQLLDLYQARPIVTGTGEPNRAIGFALALEEVLFKVSGDARLYGDPRVKALGENAGALVESFSYRDRLEGIPIHDEQGSHDRPHDLTVTFDQAKIDAALEGLGLAPWREKRPTLLVVLRVINGDQRFLLFTRGEKGDDMRDSLANATFRTNINALLPGESFRLFLAVAPPGTADDPAALAGVARQELCDRALTGTLEFSDAEHGWRTTWRIVGPDGKTYQWHQRGVSFDDAFRNALRGAAQVLSGHGAPR
jgi:hypothetical protein